MTTLSDFCFLKRLMMKGDKWRMSCKGMGDRHKNEIKHTAVCARHFLSTIIILFHILGLLGGDM